MSLQEDKYKPEIPSDYFSKLNDKLEEKLMDEEIFSVKEYPILFTLKKDMDFSIPDKYIDRFESNNQKPTEKKVIRLKFIVAAASILLLSSIFALSRKSESTESIDINPNEILNYFALDDEALEEIYFDDFNELLEGHTGTQFIDIDEEVLFDYLIEDSDYVDLALLN